VRLQDKATIVTGASSGVAEAIALGFAREVAMIIGEHR
jgi:NAD(P)-dependent dehydrogenase (short-subunit alcohol dehydrogenase family)